MSHELFDASEVYRRLGLKTFSMRERGKTPRFRGYQRYEATAASNAFWHLYRDSNIDLLYRQHAVIDIDGPEALNEIQRRGIWSPMVVYSGSNNEDVPKLHLFFRVEGMVVHNRQRLNGIVGLDVRGNALGGGYSVFPPSVHPNGRRYELGENGIVPFAELPAFSDELLIRPEPQHKPRVVKVIADVRGQFHRALCYVRSPNTLGAVSHQGGHDRTFWLGCRLLTLFPDLTWEQFCVCMREFNKKCEPPWDEDTELAHKCVDAWKKYR